MLKWFNNDTVALLFLGSIAIAGVIFAMETVVTGALGAISGYIGSRAIRTEASK